MARIMHAVWIAHNPAEFWHAVCMPAPSAQHACIVPCGADATRPHAWIVPAPAATLARILHAPCYTVRMHGPCHAAVQQWHGPCRARLMPCHGTDHAWPPHVRPMHAACQHAAPCPALVRAHAMPPQHVLCWPIGTRPMACTMLVHAACAPCQGTHHDGACTMLVHMT